MRDKIYINMNPQGLKKLIKQAVNESLDEFIQDFLDEHNDPTETTEPLTTIDKLPQSLVSYLNENLITGTIIFNRKDTLSHE